MKVKGVWIVDLPLTFNIGNSFYDTELTNFMFEINEAKCELIKDINGKYLDKIKVSVTDSYDDDCLPSYEHTEYLMEFTKQMSHKVSSSVQLFLDGFTYSYRHVPYRIFDGEDFITPYKFSIEPGIASGASDGDRMERGVNFDNHCLHKSVYFANKDKDYLDTAWSILNDIEYYLDIGKYKVAIISMATMVEMLIKTTLKEFLNSNGKYKKTINTSKLKNTKKPGDRPSFADKYYRFGLGLLSEKIDEDLADWVDVIYSMRNDIAHGSLLSETSFFIEENVNPHDYYNYLHHMRNVSVEVYNFFSDLKHKTLLYDIASEFRKAIEELKYQGLLGNSPLSDFPHGCCGYVSELLAMYLYEKGYFSKYIVGSKQVDNINPTYVWLETKGFVVDITADQFPEIVKSVVIELVDYEVDYLDFKVDRFYVREFDGKFMDEGDEVEIENIYNIIKTIIKE